MITYHHVPGERRIAHYALTAAKIAGIVMTLAIVTHISWNMFAPDLFGLPDLRMKQALGLVVFAGLAGFLLKGGIRPRRHG